MNLKILILIFYLFFITVSFGQINENRNFVYFYSDSVVYGRIIEYKNPFFGTPHIILDSTKISTKFVKFYKNETGFFANTASTPLSGLYSFTERIRKGKINLYENVSETYTPGSFNHTTGMYQGGTSATHIYNYYNKGYEDLKKATYNNLKIDLADNSESMIYLQKFKSIRDWQTGLTIAGGVAIVGGFISLVNRTSGSKNPNVDGEMAVISVGAVMCGASYFMSFSKPKQLRKAIDAYNR